MFFNNITGIRLVPTLVVFLGMPPLFVQEEDQLGMSVLPGSALFLFGTALEFCTEKNCHTFLHGSF